MTVRDPSMTKNNIHPYHGVPEGEKVSYDFDAPVTDKTRAFLKDALRCIGFIIGDGKMTKNNQIEIIGSFFDYSKSDNMAYKGPQGYFRVRINQTDYLVTSLIHDGHNTYEASDLIVDAIREEEIAIVNTDLYPWRASYTYETSIPQTEFNDGQVTDKIYLALEEGYPFGHAPVMVTGIQGAEFELGEITGKIYKAHNNLYYGDMYGLGQASIAGTTSHLIKALEAINANPSDFDFIPPHYMGLVEELSDVMRNGEPRLSCYNNIEKTITRTPGGIVLHGVHDSAGIGGMLPMMTKNATYDAGLTLARVILDQGLYKDVDGEPMRAQDVKQAMKDGLDAFIDGYNKTSGLELTRDESFQAARMAIMKLTLTGIGLQKQTNSPSMYDQFINKTMKPFFDKIDQAQNIIQGKVTFEKRLTPS